ncbi:cyclodeaminase/cyclohydrolase family protein [Microbacterium sp. NPDC077486]|uniref:cyclodeaminase/cyclohydrolase family protein n=1 Tax=Microbacterium sp. NPDC077486 TaxID=3154766 RepID=UPI00343FD759
MTDSADIPTSRPMDAWLDALSQPTGSPGGGAASGVMLGLAAALMGMVAGYTREDPAAAESTGRLDPVRAELLQAVEADGVVSAGFGAALALAPEDPAREERVRNAALDAAASVARLGRIGITLVAEARTLASHGNPHLAVDLAVATEALEAGLSGASLNLRANLQLARAHGASPSMRSGLDEEVGRLAEARTQVSRITAELSARLD